MYAQTVALTLQWNEMKATTCTTKNKGQVNILASLRNDSKLGNPFCMTTFILRATCQQHPLSSASTHKSLDACSCIFWMPSFHWCFPNVLRGSSRVSRVPKNGIFTSPQNAWSTRVEEDLNKALSTLTLVTSEPKKESGYEKEGPTDRYISSPQAH